MIQLKEYNPWAEAFGKFGEGAEKGYSQAKEFSNQMKLLKQKQLGKELSETQKSQLTSAEQGLETVKRQKERLATGHLGPKLNFNPWASGGKSKLFSALSGEGKKVRAGYEQAGKELIQLASTLPIRNKEEFKTLGDKLHDPSLHEEEIAGILDEMQDHIQDAYDSIIGKRTTKGSERKKITNDIIDSLLDETNNDVKKAKKLAADRGYTW